MTLELEAQILEAFANELELDGKGITMAKMDAMTDLVNALHTVRQLTK